MWVQALPHVVPVVCQHTVLGVHFTCANELSPRGCLNRDLRVAHTRVHSQQKAQKCHQVWGVRQFSCTDETSAVSWADNQSWFIFITAVNVAIKLQRGMAVPEVCTASEEALNNLCACVPLWKGKHTVGKVVLLGDAYRGLSFHLKSIFPDSVLWIWQLIKISSILMCVTTKNKNCRLKSVLHWTCGTEVFHSDSSIYFEYVKGLGAINCCKRLTSPYLNLISSFHFRRNICIFSQ